MYQDNVDALIAAWNEGNMDGLDSYFTADTVRKAPAALSSDANSLTNSSKSSPASGLPSLTPR